MASACGELCLAWHQDGAAQRAHVESSIPGLVPAPHVPRAAAAHAYKL